MGTEHWDERVRGVAGDEEGGVGVEQREEVGKAGVGGGVGSFGVIDGRRGVGRAGKVGRGGLLEVS